MAYPAYILAGEDHRCWHQHARSVDCEENICAALTRPAIWLTVLPRFCFSGSIGEEWKFIPDRPPLRSRSLQAHVSDADSRPEEIYCAGGVQTWCFVKIFMCWLCLSLTFCTVGGFVGCARYHRRPVRGCTKFLVEKHYRFMHSVETGYMNYNLQFKTAH